MMQDIKRICENPSPEDKAWFPELANTDWLTSLDSAMRHFKDESFISQYLSPKIMRDLKLFLIHELLDRYCRPNRNWQDSPQHRFGTSPTMRNTLL
jgi:spore cortex formation protein SpoVR/YcgB (stage V sporulation)